MSSTTDKSPGPQEANLHVLSFSSLLNGDKSELANLLSACEDHGFFYLDLRDEESGKILQQLEATWEIMKPWFSQPLEEKLKTKTISDAHGFKPPGVQSGVNENTRDGFEALRISRVGLLSRSDLPDVVKDNIDLFEAFQLSAHYVLKSLLDKLADASGLRESDRFETYHPDDLPSKSTLFFIHHPVSESLEDKTARGHNAHTDVGSFTLLFTEQPGLQVLSPVTNMSAMHRVLPPGGNMSQDRYSAAYFLRASDTAVFKGIDGEEVTAEQWFLNKYSSFNKTLEEQRLDSVATGGMDKDLGVLV
ncbi:hypothetical protein FLONG3_10581 [Fusarium longipes]|uniref:Non-haem dioxygenase N-terminal domain-containing protein n=1 Tax=Fusarium longipes TaxID=694270 RepID=A0A395RMJ8_9HYPO|nr:hypothetical protein FLONG3_10581 [Fusarium longipes]